MAPEKYVKTIKGLVLCYTGGYVVFNDRDLEVYEAHSIEECDNAASTKQIAKALGETVRATAARLRGMQKRGLCWSEPGSWDETADWRLTTEGVQLAEAYRDRPLRPLEAFTLEEAVSA